MKLRSVEAGLFHAGGPKDGHTEANSHFFAILRTRLKMVYAHTHAYNRPKYFGHMTITR